MGIPRGMAIRVTKERKEPWWRMLTKEVKEGGAIWAPRGKACISKETREDLERLHSLIFLPEDLGLDSNSSSKGVTRPPLTSADTHMGGTCYLSHVHIKVNLPP